MPTSPSLRPSTPQDPPPFQPLFTLLTTSSQTHHPTVHYLFSNDPTDPLTTAALETLSPSSSPSPSTATQKERYLIIDLDTPGTNVVVARSITPEWAVTSAEVGKAPTWGEGKEEAGEGEGGALMLRIEGVEAAKGVNRGKGNETEVELEELVERYMRGLEGLRRVVEGVGRGGDVEGEAGGAG